MISAASRPNSMPCNIPAPGEPELARRIADDLQAAGFPARAVDRRGFDHGVWVPLKLAYPDADIPVVSVSVDPDQGPEHHYRLGQALAGLARRACW
jgi:4,5-DOPA dioxygenase extradiol